jgi:CHAT domain-containing protein/Tfp pilus assembly protein PilF
MIARQAGTYQLEVRALERAAPRGRYDISLGELRAATPRDESRVAAEQTVTEGETLRARKTAVTLPQALEKFGQAIALWRALDEPYETAVALYGRCLTHRLLGDNERAVADCGESLNTMRALGDSYGEAVARTGRGWAYMYLGDADKALADFTASLAARRNIGDPRGETIDLVGMGWAHALRGGYDRALEFFQQSDRVSEAHGDLRGKAIRLAGIGEVYRRMNRPAQAVEYLSWSLQLSRELNNDRGGEAETLTNLGWCRHALGQPGEAKDNFSAALLLRREVGDRTGEAITLLGLAHAERGQGNLYNARQHVESALAIVESLRAQVVSQPLRLSFFALAQDYYEFYVDLLMHMHRLDPERGHAASALEISERARARSLLDLLRESEVDVRQGVPADLLERERVLRARLNTAAAYQRGLLSETYTAAQSAAAAKDVGDLSDALSEVESQIRQASPRYAALTQARTSSAEGIQRDMGGSDTVLLEYALGKERSFVWAVSSATISAYALPARREVEALAGRVSELLTARNAIVPGETPARRRERVEQADAQYHEAAGLLSRMLLVPVAAHLVKAKRLVVVAPGALQLIPFGALPAPKVSVSPLPQNEPPLIVTHELVVLPSASTLAMLRRDTGRGAARTKEITILADPVFSRDDERFDGGRLNSVPLANVSLRPGGGAAEAEGGGDVKRPVADGGNRPSPALPRLFRTRWEAEQIAALLPTGEAFQALDFAASRETATGAAVGGSRVVHFATHAVVDNERPELSGIALSMFDREGKAQDGFLRSHDLFNLNLSADLVVLSACRTALGKEFRGEGLIGLARGFMYAGAPRVVGSLWATDDKATAELMVRFYRKMLRDGLPAAAALRAAQIEMLRDRRWRAPYFWAGFTLQGEWRP